MTSAYRGSTARLLLLAGAMFMVGTNASVIAGLLPQIANQLGTTQATVSYSITVYAVIVAIAAPLASIFLARASRAVLMACGAAFFSIGTIVAATSVNVEGFIGGRGIAALGGAALVPTASAVATSLVPPERRGRALAMVSAGFTLSGAIGTPLGTALGSIASWRLPMWCLASIGIIVGIGIALLFRKIPTAAPVPIRRRLAPLADRRVIAAVLTTLFMVVAFNVVFIFSASLTSGATGGEGTLLAVLLMGYGLAGVVGNLIAGPVTDRYGSRVIAVIALVAVGILLGVLPLTVWSFPLCLMVFAVWGFVAAGTSVPVQHRLVVIDPDAAAVTLSWNSTAMYVGIALSPPLGNFVIGLGGPLLTPVAGVICVGLALVSFLIGLLPTRSRVSVRSVRGGSAALLAVPVAERATCVDPAP
ncbi:MFS transporter [Humibacter sp. RRB41]|uniref:MFS transporter n=1 Tax=Humibacter sp. RRB41 TaxID=2919946 RepID=UPI001FA9546A|nr:MFS transporter [Humibacter sp. RRB41]